MRKACIVVLLAGLATLSPFQSVHASMTWTFDTIPASGDITGAPGDTVGWGYTITNESTLDENLWLEINNLVAGVFGLGVGLDVFDYPILAPATTLTIPYALGVGLYEVALTATGAPDTGVFELSGQWYDDDPSGGGSALDLAQAITAPYSLTVTAVPEPSRWPVVIFTLAALAFLVERRTSMFRRPRLARFLVAAVTFPLLLAGEAMAGGGLLPTIPFGWVLNTSKDVTAEIALDPNGPVVPGLIGATPTGTLGTITIDRKHYAPATAVFQVQPDSTLGGLALGCDLSVTGSRFVEVAPGQPGLPMGSPGSSNWLAPDTTTALFSQVGVTLVDQSLQVVMIPGITRVVSQQCAPFPASYPSPSGNAGFLILNVEIGFWAAPGTETPK